LPNIPHRTRARKHRNNPQLQLIHCFSIKGFDTGQISGFLEMPDFLERFHDLGDQPNKDLPNPYAFSNVRAGTIVALLSIGTLLGALLSAPVADTFGRKVCIIFWNIVFIVGVIIQIATETAWYQIAIGRLIAGLGVGGLSVLTPMYMSETAPRQIRGTMVSSYQLNITFGILVAYLINFGTEAILSPASWRIPMGVGFIWPAIMIAGIIFLPESPRWDYRHGNIERATATVARSYGVTQGHWEVKREMGEIKKKFDAETAGTKKWHEIFTGPRMAYRTLLGVTLQALQQLTGANFFFYYGTTIFQSTGLENSYVTSIILGAVNFGMTFPGLYVVEKAGRRRALIAGALWMFMCFMVFSSVGHFVLNRANPQATPMAGTVMVVFACLFIAGYAMTWGPVIWVVVGELYVIIFASFLASDVVSYMLTEPATDSRLDTEPCAWAFPAHRTGSGTSSSPSSLPSSRLPSTSAMDTSSRHAASSRCRLCISSSRSTRAARWRRSTPCMSRTFPPGRARNGSCPKARSPSRRTRLWNRRRESKEQRGCEVGFWFQIWEFAGVGTRNVPFTCRDFDMRAEAMMSFGLSMCTDAF
jgi:sugar porter (SP) family MFS transporter